MSSFERYQGPAIVAGFCLKKKYRTHAFAEQVRAKCERERGVALFIYLCPNPGCLMYHLTKQSHHKGRAL